MRSSYKFRQRIQEEHGKHQIDSLRDQKGRCEKDMTKVQVEKEKIITSLAKLNHEHAEATKFRKVHFENMSRICRKYTIGGSPASEEEVNAASSKRVLRSFYNIQMELKRMMKPSFVVNLDPVLWPCRPNMTRTRPVLDFTF